MDEIRYQNKALSSVMIHSILREVEVDWSLIPMDPFRESLEEFATALLILFGVSLQGEEILLMSLRGMLDTWLESTTALSHPYVMITLHRCIKDKTGLRWPCLPLTIHTNSGLPIKKWISRFLRRKFVGENRQTGWLFAWEDSAQKPLSEFNPCC